MGIFTKNTNDEQFKETIEALQNLNKVTAPDNFEFNLMVKINNRQFEKKHYAESNRKVVWILPPAAAVVLSSVFLFIILSSPSEDFQNPLVTPPVLRAEYQPESPAKKGPVEYYAKETNSSKASVRDTREMTEDAITLPSEETNYRVVVQPNDVIVQEKFDLPFDNSNSVNLDSYLDGSKSVRSTSPATLAREGGYPVFDFNGFVTRERVDRKTLEAYKNRMDSLKSVERRK